MPGLGTLIDMSGIVAGGMTALTFGRFLTDNMKQMMMTICGISVFVIGITGVMQGMLTVSGGTVSVQGSVSLLISLVAGTLIGELMNIEGRIKSLGRHGAATDFAGGFVKAFLVVGVGAMAVMGPINEGLYGDHSLLIAKAVFDFVIIMVLTMPYGKGCLLASLPVGLLQGTLTIAACQAKAFLTDAALSSLTTTGSVMILCLDINLIWNKEIRVANMLPMVVIGAVLSYLW
ncbi:MAG: DUF554 domain-containing protein [Firmicutes bacterium]|nr:DUF554 domain-containing protein [Bacillota bacterium]